jgi:hypothetical protein
VLINETCHNILISLNFDSGGGTSPIQQPSKCVLAWKSWKCFGVHVTPNRQGHNPAAGSGYSVPDEQIYVDDEPADLPSGSIEVTFADTDANYACVPSGGPDVSLISIEMGEIFTICSKWYPGCEN